VAKFPYAEWDPIERPDGSGLWMNPNKNAKPNKIIHHRTQGSSYPRTTYVKGGGVPHFTVGRDKIWQHYDTEDAARALFNMAGTPFSPNTDGTIQIEAIGWSGSEDLQVARNVAILCVWLEWHHGIPNVWPMGRPPMGGAINPAPASVWFNQPGHYSHSQAPDNRDKHWDPAYTDTEWAIIYAREGIQSPAENVSMPVVDDIPHVDTVDSPWRIEFGPFRPSLWMGGENSEFHVRALQAFLGVSQTSVYDTTTYNAIRAFQRYLGLVVDGIVGPETWGRVDAVNNTRPTQPSIPNAPPLDVVALKADIMSEVIALLRKARIEV
jgi:hypothetical protein